MFILFCFKAICRHCLGIFFQYLLLGNSCSSGVFVSFSTMGYVIVRCLRRSAVNTLSEAIGFRPRKVVRLFSSVSDITSNNFAIHSSANELLTTLTPVKSSTTRSFCSINGCNDSRTRLPKGRVPKFSPYSLKLNITIVPLIRCRSKMFRYIVPPR